MTGLPGNVGYNTPLQFRCFDVTGFECEIYLHAVEHVCCSNTFVMAGWEVLSKVHFSPLN